MTSQTNDYYFVTLSNISSDPLGYKGYYLVEKRYKDLLEQLSETLNSFLLSLPFGYLDNPTGLNRSSLLTQNQIKDLRYELGNLIKLTKDGINGQYLTPDMYNGKIKPLMDSLELYGFIMNQGGVHDIRIQPFLPDGSLERGTDAGLNAWVNEVLWASKWYNQPTPQYLPGPIPISGIPLPGGPAMHSLNNLLGSGPTDNTWFYESGFENQVSENVLNDILETSIVDLSTAPNPALLNLAGSAYGVPYSSTPSTAFTPLIGILNTLLNGAAVNNVLSSGEITLLNQTMGKLLKLALDGSLTESQINNLNTIFTTLADFSGRSLFGLPPEFQTNGWGVDLNNNFSLTGVTSAQWQAWFQSILVNPAPLLPVITVTSLAASLTTAFNIGDIAFKGKIQSTEDPTVTGRFNSVKAYWTNQVKNLVNALPPSAFVNGKIQIPYYIFDNINNNMFDLVNLMTNGVETSGVSKYLTAAQMSELKGLIPDTSNWIGLQSNAEGAEYFPVRTFEVAGVPFVTPQFPTYPAQDFETNQTLFSIIKRVLARSPTHTLNSDDIYDLNYLITSGQGDFIRFYWPGPELPILLHSLTAVSSALAPPGSPQSTFYSCDNTPAWHISDSQWQDWIAYVASNPNLFAPIMAQERLLPTTDYSTYLGSFTVDGGAHSTVGIYSPISSGFMAQAFDVALDSIYATLRSITNNTPLGIAPQPYTSLVYNGWRQPTSAQVTELQNAFGQLIYLAVNGDGQGNYLSQEQVRQLKPIFAELKIDDTNFASVVSAIVNPATNNAVADNTKQITTYKATGLDADGVARWYNFTKNPNITFYDGSIFRENSTSIPSDFYPPKGFLYLAGNIVPVPIAATDNPDFDTYVNNFQSILKQAMNGDRYLTPDQIAGLNQNMGQLFFLAFDIFQANVGTLSQDQLEKLNSLFVSVSNFATDPTQTVLGTTPPLFPESVGSHWEFDFNSHILIGVSDAQWQEWFNSVTANQDMLEPLIHGVDLLPTVSVSVAGVPYTIKVSSTQNGTLTSTFNSKLGALNALTAGLDPFSVLTATQIQNINNALQGLIPLAVRGDNNKHFLTVSQISQFQAAVNRIPFDGVHVGVLEIAGIVNLVLPAPQATNADSQIFTQLLTNLNIILQTALTDPPTPGNFSLTAQQIKQLSDNLNQAIQIALIVDNHFQGTGWGGGHTIQQGRYTIDQLNSLNALLKSISQVSSNAADTSSLAYTSGWGISSTNFLNANETTNTAQWNAWLQSIVNNPNILAPLLKATDILPLFFYDSNGLISTAVNTAIKENSGLTSTYTNYVQTFQGILQAASLAGDITSAQMTQLSQVIGQLTLLAKNGDGNGHYLTQEQANNINDIYSSMKSFPARYGISLPIWYLDENNNNTFVGMTTDAWRAWFFTLLNDPQPVLNPTRVYSLGDTLAEAPVAWSRVGSVGAQGRFNTLIEHLQVAFIQGFNAGSNPAQLNDYLDELIALAQSGDAAGGRLSGTEATQLSNIFDALAVSNPDWTTVDSSGNRTISATAANWVAARSAIDAISVFGAPPAQHTPLIFGGTNVYVRTSATANTDLTNALNAITSDIKTVLQDAAAAGGTSLTTDQMKVLEADLAKYYLLAQNGDGRGHYLTQTQASDLNRLLNDVSIFASIDTPTPAYVSPGWAIPLTPQPSLSGISSDQWQLWYTNLLHHPNNLSPLLTFADVLPPFQYNFGGIPNSLRPVFPVGGELNPSITPLINNYLVGIQTNLQEAAGRFTGPNSTNPPGTLTSAEITALKTFLGDYIKLAQQVLFPTVQAQNLDSLLQSLLAIVPSGWTLPAPDNNGHSPLGGISDAQWSQWFNSILSNPNGLATLFQTGQPIDLSFPTLLAAGYIPTSSIHLAGVATTIVTPNVPAVTGLLSSFNTPVSGIAGAIQDLVKGGFSAASSTLSAVETAKFKQYVGQLIYLAQNGDIDGDFLTSPLATQLDQLLSSIGAYSSIALSGANHSDGWSLNASHVLAGVSDAQWTAWLKNLIANPTTVSQSLQLSSVSIAGVPTSLWVAKTSSSEPQVDNAYTQLVKDVELLLQQYKASGSAAFTPAQITSLNQAVGLLVYLVRNDGLNGYAVTSSMVDNLNVLFASLDDFSTTTVAPTAANYTAGWVLDNTGALTVAGVNGATATSITTAQWQAWANSILATPAQLSPLYPVDFLSSLSLADAGVVPSTTMDIAGVLKKVQVAPSMTDDVTVAYTTNLQGLKNVIVGFVAMGLKNPTTAQIQPYIEILNRNLGTLMNLVSAGSLTASTANALNVLTTSLSAFSTTAVAAGNQAYSAGWAPASHFADKTAVTDNQWLAWLNFVTKLENQNSLAPLIPGNSFAGPFLTLNFGGVILNVPFSVITTNALNSQYNALVGSIGDTLKASKTGSAFTSSQINQMKNDIGTLLYLSQYGDTRGNVLTLEMQKNISLLASSLTASGVNTFDITSIGPNAYTLNIGDPQLWNVWRDLALSSNILQGFLKSDTLTINAQRSLQAMVELNYVKLGNEMLAGQLTGLQNALSTTQTILNTLTGLQNIHNELVVSSKGTFSAFFHPSAGMKSAGYKWTNPETFVVTGGSSGNGFAAAYKYYASAYFGKPIAPEIKTPDGSKYQVDVNNPANWLVELAFNQPPLEYGSTGVVDVISKSQTASTKSATVTNQKASYKGFYIQVPNNFTVPQSVLDKYNLITPQSIKASVVFASVVHHSDFGSGSNEGTNTKLLQPLFASAAVGSIKQKSGFTLYITSTSFPKTLTSQQDQQFTTNSTEYTALKGVLNQLTQLKAGYNYNRADDGARTLVPKGTTDPLKTYIQTVLGGFPTGLTSTLNNLLTNKATLSAQLATLLDLNKDSKNDPNSLYSMTNKVYLDLKNTLVTQQGVPITTSTQYGAAFSGLAKWLLDGYQKAPGTAGATQAGQYQQNITFAVTAAQSLNSQQQQKVSNYLFVFEEFEKSAAAILQQLTQIIQHIAQNLAR